MIKPTRLRAAGWLAAGALLTTALLAPATVSASSPKIDPHHDDGGSCTSSLFSWNKSGQNTYPMLSVTVQAKGALPQGCTFSFSLNSYTAEGPTWPTSGTQALFDHDSITLSADQTSGTLTVEQPPCFGQTDFYTGTTKYDGQDGALPHYPNVVTPYGLLAYSNGGTKCEQPSSSPSQPVESESVPPSSSPSDQPSTSPSDEPSWSPSDSPSQPVESESVPPSDQPSESPSDQPSTSPSDSPSTSPSDSPSTSPSDSPSTSPSSSPSGSVEAETGTPNITPPPTDTTTPNGGASGTGWQVILLVSAGLIASLLVLTPAKSRRR
jgi:hypothetical protein